MAMQPTVKKWILFAEADLSAAEYLYKKPNANQWTYLLVVWHAHQAIEKILKALIIKKGKELLYIHDLPKLTKLAEINMLSSQQKDFILLLNQYYLTPRYPDLPMTRSYPRITAPQTKHILRDTKELFLCLKNAFAD